MACSDTDQSLVYTNLWFICYLLRFFETGTKCSRSLLPATWKESRKQACPRLTEASFTFCMVCAPKPWFIIMCKCSGCENHLGYTRLQYNTRLRYHSVIKLLRVMKKAKTMSFWIQNMNGNYSSECFDKIMISCQRAFVTVLRKI